MPTVANFLDTNILVYAFSDDPRAMAAQALMAEPFMISIQALNEFANVSRKKLRLSWEQIEQAIDDLSLAATGILSMDQMTNKSALALAGRYNLAFYDALMVSAALRANCSQFYWEDLHDGLLIEEKLTIINPFR